MKKRCRKFYSPIIFHYNSHTFPKNIDNASELREPRDPGKAILEPQATINSVPFHTIVMTMIKKTDNIKCW